MSNAGNEENIFKGRDSLEAHECRGEFWLMLEEALIQAGGHCDLDQLKVMSLGEVVDLVAQNGLRIVHFPGCSLSHSNQSQEQKSR